MGTFLVLCFVFFLVLLWSDSFFTAIISLVIASWLMGVDLGKVEVIISDAADKIEKLEAEPNGVTDALNDAYTGLEERPKVELNPDKHDTPKGIEHYTGKSRIQILPSSIARRLNLDPKGIRDRLRKSDLVDVFWTEDGVYEACQNEGLGSCFTNPDFLMHDNGVVYACVPNEISCYVVRGNDG